MAVLFAPKLYFEKKVPSTLLHSENEKSFSFYFFKEYGTHRTIAREKARKTQQFLSFSLFFAKLVLQIVAKVFSHTLYYVMYSSM